MLQRRVNTGGIDMARIIGGIIAAVGFLFALLATINVHFVSDFPLSRVIIGAIGLALAFGYAVFIRENSTVQRVALLVIMGLCVLMTGPILVNLFIGTTVTALQIVTAILGFVLFFIGWRMLPR
jgi:hypothetical protein